MAEITAKQVKELRDRTNAGMMECKKALQESEGDIEKAVDILRERGVIKAAQRAGRETNEGLVATHITEDGRLASIVEVACETDFVSATDEFQSFSASLAKTIADEKVADLDALNATNFDETDETVEEVLTSQIHTIGENMKITRMDLLEVEAGSEGSISEYIHMGGKIGVLVQYSFDNPATAENDDFKSFAHDVALHVAASAPLSLDRDSIDPDVLEREKNIFYNQAKESGKPEHIQDKIVEGRVNKFFEENTLIEQEFIKDPDKKIKDLVKDVSQAADDKVGIAGFVRFKIGEE